MPRLLRQLSSPNTLELSLRPRRRVIVFLMAVGLPALMMAAATIRIALAATLGESLQLPELHEALALDPSNPELYHQLGLAYVSSVEKLNETEAVRHFRKATELNPQVEVYWSDLASACELAGDNVCADQAFERALKLNPMTPDVHWITANHYLRTSRANEAFPHFRRLLEIGPEYAVSTFQVCLRTLHDPEVIFQEVLATCQDSKPKLAYIDFLSAQGDLEFAYKVWKQVASSSYVFSLSLVKPYLERLIDLGRTPEAVSVWQDLEHLGIVRMSTTENHGNLLLDGGFEQPPLNAGFDWHYRALPYLSLDFSNVLPYQNQGCLSLDFTVKQNDEYEPLYQTVPVVASNHYLLTAYARSEAITSDRGPQLRVVDPACPTCLDAQSEVTVGTTSWHPFSLEFMTGAKTQFIRVSVWRERSRTFPSEITGRFWLDEVSLTALSPIDPKSLSGSIP